MSLIGSLVTLNDFQTVSSGVMKPVTLWQKVYDTFQIFNGATLTVPEGVKMVKVYFQVKWDWDNDPAKSVGFRIAQVRKNGTDDTQIPESRILAAPGTYTTQNGSTPAIMVDAGDIFELWVGQDSGQDLRMFAHQTWFAMEVAVAVPVFTV